MCTNDFFFYFGSFNECVLEILLISFSASQQFMYHVSHKRLQLFSIIIACSFMCFCYNFLQVCCTNAVKEVEEVDLSLFNLLVTSRS